MPRKAKSLESEALSPEELIQSETEPKKRTRRKKEEQIPIPELTPEELGEEVREIQEETQYDEPDFMPEDPEDSYDEPDEPDEPDVPDEVPEDDDV